MKAYAVINLLAFQVAQDALLVGCSQATPLEMGEPHGMYVLHKQSGCILSDHE